MKRRYWTEEEDKFLVENYELLNNKEIAKRLNRTEVSIKNRARKLGVKKTSHLWEEHEKDVLRKHYHSKGIEGVKHLLPKRNVHSIYKMAENLGLECDMVSSRIYTGRRSDKLPRGFYYNRDGYVMYLVEGDRDNVVYYHRYLMEKKLGRKLGSDEIVHHKDGNKSNNSLDNLELTNRSKHIEIHREDLLAGRYSPTL